MHRAHTHTDVYLVKHFLKYEVGESLKAYQQEN